MNNSTNRLKTRRRGLVMLGAFILLLVIFLIWQDNSIVITRLSFGSAKVPESFGGFRIAQVSDLHNKSFGSGQKYILNKLESARPDIIVVTGDLIDRRRYDLDTAMVFIEGALKIAPVYYVTGNHEAWSDKYPEIRERLAKAGVTVLDGEAVSIKKGKDSINIIGLSDPAFQIPEGAGHYDDSLTASIRSSIKKLLEPDSLNILLAHRPELFGTYKVDGLDLIFSGHAHGGQIRLPFIGGILAPGQGFFPKYTSGMYTEDGVSMAVSRGLGNSVFPFRVFNRPEIVVVTLEKG